MTGQYRVFFGFQQEPFAQGLRVKDMIKSDSVIGAKKWMLSGRWIMFSLSPSH